jgi:cellulose synthase/poly-beta-1,6-N-acetylglucosamine synthase-like glycosyltransferase
LADSGAQNVSIPPDALAFMYALPTRKPELSATHTLTERQKKALFLIALVLSAGFVVDILTQQPHTLIIINGLLLTFYLVVVIFKSYLIHLSITSRREIRFTAEELAALRDEDLPVYTVLVPLYREASVLPRLVEGLRNLEYPKEKLDVMLLLEQDDAETLEATRRMPLPAFVRAVVVPDCQPKTKPKACNLGLALARGKYLVIYDAEDRPEPDQLKKAVLGFQRVGENVVCLQAKLNFYNQRQNILTRWFTTDYSVWFDLVLPGLDHLEAPIPLGGTSNHFRVDKLRELLGWDPYNVTEDCDLGVRLALNGYRTRIIDSTTWEEACSSLLYWIRQRSRWTKGYIQTYLVHLRNPVEQYRALGPGKAFAFHLLVGGTCVCLLVNPLYWALTTAWFAFRWEAFSHLFPFPLILWGLVCLFAGNFLFVYSTMLATYQRGYYDIVKHCITVPAYWLLASVGAWKGFIQLFSRPSFWEKTQHGLDGVKAAAN